MFNKQKNQSAQHGRYSLITDYRCISSLKPWKSLLNHDIICLHRSTRLFIAKQSIFENLPGNNRASIAEKNFSLWYAVLSVEGSW